MKIGLVGPGIMSIPPVGWGAVEILIWDYYGELRKLGHDVHIVNKMGPKTLPYFHELIHELNQAEYDFIHIHYDCLFQIVPYLTCKKIGMTSHYPYIDNKEKQLEDGFTPFFQFMVNYPGKFFMLAQKDTDFLIQCGANPECFLLMENGIPIDKYRFVSSPSKGDKTVYLGKVTPRKRQHVYGQLDHIELIGPGGEGLPNWKGSWTRDQVYGELTHYGNLLLCSEGEADPLVVKEALVCGLGIVVNRTSSKNIESCAFITIIEDNQMDNLVWIQQKMDENRAYAVNHRDEIREYGKRFSMEHTLKKYINMIG
jgi:hypothetical protein